MKKIIYNYAFRKARSYDEALCLRVLEDGEIVLSGLQTLWDGHRLPIDESLRLTRALQFALGICDHGCEVPCPDCGCGT